MKKRLRDSLKEIKQKYRSGVYPSKAKKSACICDDVARIIRATPDTLSTKAEEASLWLFSLFTGARAITVVDILLRDLSVVNGILHANLRVTKGNSAWNHRISLSEDNSLPQELRFFYWLRLHLRISHGLDGFDAL